MHHSTLPIRAGLLLVLGPFCSTVAAQAVVINEFVYDDESADDREFVELYNSSGGSVDISGWVLESRDSGGVNSSFTVPASTILASNDYYVLGAATVANVDQVVGVADIWEDDNESLTLRDGTNAIVDTLIYESHLGVFGVSLVEGEGVWGEHVSLDVTPSSVSRVPNGQDTNNNRDFHTRTITPGFSNDLGIPFINNISANNYNGPPGTVMSWGRPVTPLYRVTPGVISPENPSAIPPSFEGGNCAISWNPAGGGSMRYFNTISTIGDVSVECWVYFDATLEAAGEREAWSLGAQGTTDIFYNFPDPSGTNGFTANGNTGVSWTYEVDDTSATLYLIDHGDGGWGGGAVSPPTVIGAPITITPGVNDGWRRLGLRIAGSSIEGRFGGFPGCRSAMDVVRTGVASSAVRGSVYTGYRASAGAVPRPLTFDAMSIYMSEGGNGVWYRGLSSDNSISTPTLNINGPPQCGNAGFSIVMDGLVPGNGGAVSMFIRFDEIGGIWPDGIPLFLIGFGNAPINARLYLFPWALVFTIPLVDQNGQAEGPAPIPNDAILRGASLQFQLMEIDLGLINPPAVTFPVATSNVMIVKIG